MATFAITVFFHRRCLFTKRASYINFSHCIPHPKPDISHFNQHIEYTTVWWCVNPILANPLLRWAFLPM
ncbi:hypothetical protein [Candidatus Symbiopectobacterium sp.]|uniref:hypothetical protein n=1 Tax=Candidatus Symbiopectobacterium sp. TaxID=2816440 RepID=UPI0025BD1F4B|nr:hypothetical protein [Candidatus Symbiopectobacterium sp.]